MLALSPSHEVSEDLPFAPPIVSVGPRLIVRSKRYIDSIVFLRENPLVLVSLYLTIGEPHKKASLFPDRRREAFLFGFPKKSLAALLIFYCFPDVLLRKLPLFPDGPKQGGFLHINYGFLSWNSPDNFEHTNEKIQMSLREVF